MDILDWMQRCLDGIIELVFAPLLHLLQAGTPSVVNAPDVSISSDAELIEIAWSGFLQGWVQAFQVMMAAWPLTLAAGLVVLFVFGLMIKNALEYEPQSSALRQTATPRSYTLTYNASKEYGGIGGIIQSPGALRARRHKALMRIDNDDIGYRRNKGRRLRTSKILQARRY